MPKKRGRTNRIRKEKIALKNSNSKIFLEDLIILSKWMGENGFKSFKKLKPKYFEDSGRGLMAEEKISQGDIIISIPERLLITPSKVLNSDLRDYFKRYLPKATGHQVLCMFLMLEKIKSKLSKWHPYLSSLPQTYDIPAYFSSYTSFKPPTFLGAFIIKQINLIKTSYEELIPLIKALELSSSVFHDSLSFELYKWAWCTVNTRCVYIDCFQKFCAGKSCSFHLALVPYLDLLNHNPKVQVDAGFNKESNQYEIKSLCTFKKYSQVFINYGPHDNRTLLIEYGFIVPNNCNDTVPFTVEDLISAYEGCQLLLPDFSTKLDFIVQNDLMKNACCLFDGISWNLSLIIKILTSNHHIKWWKSRIPYCTDTFDKEDSNYVAFMKNILSLKIKEYENYFLDNIECQDKCLYFQENLSQLLLLEKSILLKAI